MSPRSDRLLHPARKGKTEPNGSAKATVGYPHEPSADAEVAEEKSTAGSAPATSRSAVKRRRPNAADTSAVKSLPRKTTQYESRRPRSSGQDAMVPWEALSGYANVHSFSWANDPYDVDPEITMHYIDTYFIHINAATYRIFSCKLFKRWIKTEKAKSPDDLMIVYTILAMGSVFSSRAERKHEGSLFSKIARYAVEKNHGNFSIQLIQSRLLLAFYHFALGETHKAWDFGGMGFRVASGLKLNLEEGVTDIGDDDVMEYGLNRHALAECRRRTFWSAYMMDVSVATEARPLIMLTVHSGSAASALLISVLFMMRIHSSVSLARRRFTIIKNLSGRPTLTTSSPIKDYARTQFHRNWGRWHITRRYRPYGEKCWRTSIGHLINRFRDIRQTMRPFTSPLTNDSRPGRPAYPTICRTAHSMPKPASTTVTWVPLSVCTPYIIPQSSNLTVTFDMPIFPPRVLPEPSAPPLTTLCNSWKSCKPSPTQSAKKSSLRPPHTATSSNSKSPSPPHSPAMPSWLPWT